MDGFMLKVNAIPYLILMGLLTSCGMSSDSAEGSACGTKEACLNDPKCFCWCSQICNFRKKESDDHPVYYENDKRGKYCYCKQWDYDNFKANCVLGEHIKEPPGSK